MLVETKLVKYLMDRADELSKEITRNVDSDIAMDEFMELVGRHTELNELILKILGDEI